MYVEVLLVYGSRFFGNTNTFSSAKCAAAGASPLFVSNTERNGCSSKSAPISTACLLPEAEIKTAPSTSTPDAIVSATVVSSAKTAFVCAYMIRPAASAPALPTTSGRENCGSCVVTGSSTNNSSAPRVTTSRSGRFSIVNVSKVFRASLIFCLVNTDVYHYDLHF